MLSEAAWIAVDAAQTKWSDAERAWLAVEWALARDPLVGVPLVESGAIRGFIYRGAQSIGQPDIEVIYRKSPHDVVIESAVFSDAKASQAGHS